MGKDGGVFGEEGGLGVLGDEGHGGSYLAGAMVNEGDYAFDLGIINPV